MAFQSGGFQPADAAPDNRFNSTIVPVEPSEHFTAFSVDDDLREAIINAVLHNRWVDGNEPMISVFSDRIEILSRGTLAPAQTMEGFF